MVTIEFGYGDIKKGKNLLVDGMNAVQSSGFRCPCGHLVVEAFLDEPCEVCNEIVSPDVSQDYVKYPEKIFIYPHVLGILENAMTGFLDRLLGKRVKGLKFPKMEDDYYFVNNFRSILNNIILHGTQKSHNIAVQFLRDYDSLFTDTVYFGTRHFNQSYNTKSSVMNNSARVIANLSGNMAYMNIILAKDFQIQHELHVGKTSTSRSTILATRLFYTARCTILPHNEGMEDIHMPYVAMLNMLRIKVCGFYIRETKLSLNEINKIIDDSFNTPNEYIIKIFERLIDEGLYGLMTRNPAQSFPSINAKRITKISYNNCMYINGNTVGGPNADFDGDQNHFKLFTDKQLQNLFDVFDYSNMYRKGVFGLSGKIATIQDSSSVINSMEI